MLSANKPLLRDYRRLKTTRKKQRVSDLQGSALQCHRDHVTYSGSDCDKMAAAEECSATIGDESIVVSQLIGM